MRPRIRFACEMLRSFRPPLRAWKDQRPQGRRERIERPLNPRVGTTLPKSGRIRARSGQPIRSNATNVQTVAGMSQDLPGWPEGALPQFGAKQVRAAQPQSLYERQGFHVG